MDTMKSDVRSALLTRPQTAGLVVLTSALLLVEGISRTSLYVGTPPGQWAGNHTTFPAVVLLIAAVGVILYSFLSLTLGFAELVLEWGSRKVTLAVLLLEFVFGWFFFISNVFAVYPFMVDRAAGPMPGFNKTQSNAVIMMGMLGAMGSGVPLLGAHFFFMLQMAQIQGGKADMYTPTYFRARIYFYSVLLVIRGVAEVAIGSLVRQHIGKGRLASPVVAIPFVVVYPELSITDGVLVILLGLAGVIVAVVGIRRVILPFFGFSFFVLAFEFGTYIITQIGLGPAPLVVAPILTVDSIVGALMPVYLAAHMAYDGPTSGYKTPTMNMSKGKPVTSVPDGVT